MSELNLCELMVNVLCTQRCFLTLIFVSHNEMSGIPVGSEIIRLLRQEINMQINQNKGIFFPGMCYPQLIVESENTQHLISGQKFAVLSYRKTTIHVQS